MWLIENGLILNRVEGEIYNRGTYVRKIEELTIVHQGKIRNKLDLHAKALKRHIRLLRAAKLL